MIDLDAIAVEAEAEAPFEFSWGGETYTIPLLMQLPWQVGNTIARTRDAEANMRVLLGDDYDRFTAGKPMSTARLIKLLDLWWEHQGLTPGES